MNENCITTTSSEIICVGLYEELIVVSHGCSYPPQKTPSELYGY
jgi:hypothetical protein